MKVVYTFFLGVGLVSVYSSIFIDTSLNADAQRQSYSLRIEQESSFYRAVYSERRFLGSDLVGMEDRYHPQDRQVLVYIANTDSKTYQELVSYALKQVLFGYNESMKVFCKALANVYPVKVINSVKRSFSRLIISPTGCQFLIDLVKSEPREAKKLVDEVARNLDSLVSHASGRAFLIQFLKMRSAEIDKLWDNLLKDFDKFVSSSGGCALYKELLKIRPELIEVMVERAYIHCDFLASTPFGREFLLELERLK